MPAKDVVELAKQLDTEGTGQVDYSKLPGHLKQAHEKRVKFEAEETAKRLSMVEKKSEPATTSISPMMKLKDKLYRKNEKLYKRFVLPVTHWRVGATLASPLLEKLPPALARGLPAHGRWCRSRSRRPTGLADRNQSRGDGQCVGTGDRSRDPLEFSHRGRPKALQEAPHAADLLFPHVQPL